MALFAGEVETENKRSFLLYFCFHIPNVYIYIDTCVKLRYSGILFVKCHNRVKDEMLLYKKVETNRRCAVFFSHCIEEVNAKQSQTLIKSKTYSV